MTATAAATRPAPSTVLDGLFDSIRAAARAGRHVELTLQGSAEAAALRDWADRNGFPVTTEKLGRYETGARRVRWECDRVDLPSRSWITAHWDDEPAAEGAS